MKVCSWNCQGLGPRSTRQRLRQLVRINSVDVVFISETKQSPQFVSQVASDLGFVVYCMVPPQGVSGGLALLGKPSLSVDVVTFNERLIDVMINHNDVSFFMSCVYGHPVQSLRSGLWNTLKNIAQTRSLPWIMIGDFNDIISNEEKLGGAIRDDNSFFPFNDMITSCNMTLIPSTGNRFSWTGNRVVMRRGVRHLETVQACLDRGMANPEWSSNFPASNIQFLEPLASDHRPLILTIAHMTFLKRGQFKFDRRLLQHPDFEQVARDGWSLKNGSLSLSRSIKQCRRYIARWKKSANMNSNRRITSLTRELEQLLQSRHPDPIKLTSLRRQIDKAYDDEEIFWKNKSRVSWVKEGDRNTRFFHNYAKTRKARNRIHSLKDDAGLMHYGEDDISKIAITYFSDLFASSHTGQFDNYFENIIPKVTHQMNLSLTTEVTNEEIKAAVFAISPDKAPGADGISSGFYQRYWHIVESTFCHDVKHFLSSGFLENPLNHTNIVLIPKTTAPSQMSDFRPISLCSVGYKVISKILVSRLQSILPQLISENQTAFVPGRNIGDNVLLAHEIIHSLKVRKRQSKTYMAVKTDISKAYDRVEWGFLRAAMTSLGFCDQWIDWIMCCITSVSFSVLVNGSPYGSFHPKRGLRQGDPLSPYLFLFCAEILSQKLDRAMATGKLNGISISNNGPRINHLFFADDSLFFCKANRKESISLRDILHQYGKHSGQLVNYDKSSISFGSRVYATNQSTVKSTLQIYTVGGCGKYLGIPEYFGRRKCDLFRSLVTKVKERTNGWHNKVLSPAGKEVLVKSVALAMPVYPMNFFKLPITICDEIDEVLAQFWWGTTPDKRRMSWFAWKRLVHSKSDGGLGFRDLQAFNTALLGKQASRLLSNPDSLLARTLKGRYFPDTTFLDAKVGTKPSYGWTSLLHGKTFLQQGLRWQVGMGEINPWTANWLPSDPPRPAENITNSDLPLVSNLWAGHEWDPASLNLLKQEDRELALTLYIPHHRVPDKLIWNYTKDGVYTVKSGYKFARSLSPHPGGFLPPQINPQLTSRIWRSKLPSKQQHFLWKACTNSLPTTIALSTRGLPTNPMCPRCFQAPETPNHVLFTCYYAREAWTASQFPLFGHNQISDSLDANIQLMFTFASSSSLTPYQRQLPFSLCWLLWKARNELVFNTKVCSPLDTVHASMYDADSWTSSLGTDDSQAPISSPLTTSASAVSSPPPAGWFICNYDASFTGPNNLTGAGWITHSSTGEPVLAGYASLRTSFSALQAEGFAFLHAIQLLWINGYRRIIMEGDCLTLVQLINGRQQDVNMLLLLSDIYFWMQKFEDIKVIHTRREHNRLADSLAHMASLDSITCCIFSNPLDIVQNLNLYNSI